MTNILPRLAITKICKNVFWFCFKICASLVINTFSLILFSKRRQVELYKQSYKKFSVSAVQPDANPAVTSPICLPNYLQSQSVRLTILRIRFSRPTIRIAIVESTILRSNIRATEFYPGARGMKMVCPLGISVILYRGQVLIYEHFI